MAIPDDNDPIISDALCCGSDRCSPVRNRLVADSRSSLEIGIRNMGGKVRGILEEFSDWTAKPGYRVLLQSDVSVFPAIGKFSGRANDQDYGLAAASTFMQVTDRNLVAQTLTAGRSMATHNASSEFSRKSKMLGACAGLGADCVAAYAMWQRERTALLVGDGS